MSVSLFTSFPGEVQISLIKMEENLNNNSEGIASSNLGYEQSSALQIRLDTNDLLQQIEFFLRGKEVNTFFDKDSGTMRPRLVDMGEPKLNLRGIQAILNKCRGLINPSVVQGNISKDFYFKLIEDIRIEIAYLCFVNFYNWEVSYETDLKEIPDTIMNTVESYLSRSIDNQERLSYAQTIKTSETNSAGRGFSLPFGGK